MKYKHARQLVYTLNDMHVHEDDGSGGYMFQSQDIITTIIIGTWQTKI